MTDQEIYNKVRNHLLTQMKKSLSGNGNRNSSGCCYVSPDGTRCAAGCLLPQDYVPPAEYNTGHSVFDIIKDEEAPEVMRRAFQSNEGLLTSLQTVHDCYSPDRWAPELGLVADVYDLEVEAAALNKPIKRKVKWI